VAAPDNVPLQPGAARQLRGPSSSVSPDTTISASLAAAVVTDTPCMVIALVRGPQSSAPGYPALAPGASVTSIRFSLTSIGEISTLPFGTRNASNSRSSTITSPLTYVIPDALACAARSFSAVSGSSGVRIAPLKPRASL
jgi:hypothetical protein